MTSPYALAVSLLLAAPAFDAAAAELLPLKWSADGRFAAEVKVAAGKFVEACGKLPARTRVRWRFEAGVPMDFNIHFHEGEEVRFPARQEGVAKADGTLDAPSAQDYCWMWTNKSPGEAALKVELSRQ
jgi:hypothetical protein